MNARRIAVLLALAGALLLALPTSSANAQVRAFPGLDCKEAPTPDMPGQGLVAFFQKTPNPLPKQADPFAKGAHTTMYEQYGYSGLRWHTYDLGCGPDAARNPDAVIGTALSDWTINLPLSLSALTSSVTDVAFEPTFLNLFDPAVKQISGALHRSLFATWVPAMLALVGVALLFMARRAALATSAAAVGWALMVVLVATALFRWPLAAGHFADDAVTNTLGSVVGGIDGSKTDVPPAVAVSSNVQESIFYKSWLAGTLGSSDSPTARKYGPELFKDQALTWHEAYVVEHNPARGKQIIETKKDDWKTTAAQIQASDPAAYDYLTGKRSDARVGFALLSTAAAVLTLPFLLVAAFLMLGSFLIVRLAVMLFPAFATLGVFPAGRGIVVGIGRTVGAALVNSVIFGIGAAVTIRVIGLILDPHSRIPGWLALVLMPLFGIVMWVALKPFRRLTAMVSPNTNPFGEGAGAFGGASRHARRWLRKATATGVGVYTGNVAAAATIAGQDEDTASEASRDVPDRAEARAHPVEPVGTATAEVDRPALQRAPENHRPTDFERSASTPPDEPERGRETGDDPGNTDVGYAMSDEAPLPMIEPEWVDGEEVYTVYRPAEEISDDVA